MLWNDKKQERCVLIRFVLFWEHKSKKGTVIVKLFVVWENKKQETHCKHKVSCVPGSVINQSNIVQLKCFVPWEQNGETTATKAL